MRVRLGLIAILIATTTEISYGQVLAAKANTYLIDGLQYSPYARAQLEITIDENIIHGKLLPLLGDRTPPVEVTGTLQTNNRLHLEFQLSAKIQRLSFINSKAVDGEVWTSTKKTIVASSTSGKTATGGTGRIRFFRTISAPLSKAALTVYQESCGEEYGDLQIYFATNSTSAMLEQFIQSIGELKNLKSTYMAVMRRNGKEVDHATTLEVSLRKLFKYGSDALAGIDIDTDKFMRGRGPSIGVESSITVPIGAEAIIVERMRKWDK